MSNNLDISGSLYSSMLFLVLAIDSLKALNIILNPDISLVVANGSKDKFIVEWKNFIYSLTILVIALVSLLVLILKCIENWG